MYTPRAFGFPCSDLRYFPFFSTLVAIGVRCRLRDCIGDRIGLPFGGLVRYRYIVMLLKSHLLPIIYTTSVIVGVTVLVLYQTLYRCVPMVADRYCLYVLLYVPNGIGCDLVRLLVTIVTSLVTLVTLSVVGIGCVISVQ